MGLREIGIDGANWIRLAQDRFQWLAFVSTVVKLRVPQKKGHFLTSCVTVRFSRKTLFHGVS
jgi:hypothetical protein